MANKEQMKSMGERIRARREELGMSQLDLALKVNYNTKQTISMIEHGTRGVQIDRLELLADALDVSVDYLMGIEKVNLLAEIDEALKGRSEEYLKSLLQIILSQGNQPRQES